SVADDAAEFLLRTGEKTWDIFKRDQRNVKCVAKTHKPRTLYGSVDVQHAGQECRLIGNNTDRTAVHACKSDHQIFRKVFVYFKEVPLIYDGVNRVLDVIGLQRIFRNQRIERNVATLRRITAWAPWRIIQIVRRQKAQQFANHSAALGVITR